MCSVGDDIEEQTLKFMEEKPSINLASSTCMKCKSEKINILLHSKYPYCKSCFIASTVHKFKAMLGKHHAVLANDNVLVCHRAGHPSTALLHFLRTGLDLITPKKLRFQPVIIVIEKNYNLPEAQRKRILNLIDDEIKKFKFPVYFVSLTQYILKPVKLDFLIHKDINNINIVESDKSLINSILKRKPSLTVQLEYLRIVENELLLNAAKHLNCTSIFTPNLSIDVASQLLTNISLGRGENAAFDIGAIDSSDPNIKILRPLRNFTMKELAFYNIFNDLEPVSFINVKPNPHSSVQNLVEKFVMDLQINFPSTVSTIVRTGDKLDVDKKVFENEKCSLCKAPMANELKKLGSAEATQFSHLVSTHTSDPKFSMNERFENFLSTFTNVQDEKYCFACKQIIDFS